MKPLGITIEPVETVQMDGKTYFVNPQTRELRPLVLPPDSYYEFSPAVLELLKQEDKNPLHSQSGNELSSAGPDISDLPESAYKDGQLTFSGIMMTLATCQKSFENWFGGKSPKFRTWGKELLNKWCRFGYPDLGDFPPPNCGVSILDYALGCIASTVK